MHIGAALVSYEMSATPYVSGTSARTGFGSSHVPTVSTPNCRKGAAIEAMGRHLTRCRKAEGPRNRTVTSLTCWSGSTHPVTEIVSDRYASVDFIAPLGKLDGESRRTRDGTRRSTALPARSAVDRTGMSQARQPRFAQSPSARDSERNSVRRGLRMGPTRLPSAAAQSTCRQDAWSKTCSPGVNAAHPFGKS
jgi:hypothetical protein